MGKGERKSLFVSNSIYYGERALALPTPKFTRAMLAAKFIVFLRKFSLHQATSLPSPGKELQKLNDVEERLELV